MTTTMTEKNQVTIPKRITEILHIRKGCIFDVQVGRNRVELIPLETSPKVFTREQYQKLALLAKHEKGKEQKVTRTFVHQLKEGL